MRVKKWDGKERRRPGSHRDVLLWEELFALPQDAQDRITGRSATRSNGAKRKR